MKKVLNKLCFLMLFLPIFAHAHPHAFVQMKTKMLIEQDKLLGFSVQWLLDEPSSSELLYDIKHAKNDQTKQALADDIMKNVIAEHYFSYLYDKAGNKVKFSAQPRNFGFEPVGSRLMYHFDFMLARPRELKNEELMLQIYDPTYYVSMYYDEQIKSAVDFSNLPQQCSGSLIAPKVDEKTQAYAASLDKSQRDEDYSLGAQFAQKVVVTCQ